MFQGLENHTPFPVASAGPERGAECSRVCWWRSYHLPSVVAPPCPWTTGSPWYPGDEERRQRRKRESEAEEDCLGNQERQGQNWGLTNRVISLGTAVLHSLIHSLIPSSFSSIFPPFCPSFHKYLMSASNRNCGDRGDGRLSPARGVVFTLGTSTMWPSRTVQGSVASGAPCLGHEDRLWVGQAGREGEVVLGVPSVRVARRMCVACSWEHWRVVGKGWFVLISIFPFHWRILDRVRVFSFNVLLDWWVSSIRL